MFATPQPVRGEVPLTGQMTPAGIPTGGINARDSLATMPPGDAIDLVNVVTSGFGLQTRGGYQWWAWNLSNSRSVSTIMSYYPAIAELSGVSAPNRTVQDKFLPPVIKMSDITVSGQLFACTNFNIYDITVGGAGPWTPITGVGTVTSDFWTWINFQNAAGGFLAACNNEGGYIVYGGAGFSNGFSTGFRTQASGFARISEGDTPGQISGVNPDLFAYLMVWKQRIWFIEKNSSRAWYLPPQQLTGQAFQFDFGPMFRHGGKLVALVNWTLDGGEGVDDYLVAFSSMGDVVIYKGYDPDAVVDDPNAFQLHGIWYVGALPKGYRCVDPYGGDVFVLSSRGITALSQLVSGKSGEEAIGQISYKIDPMITRLVRQSGQKDGWYMKYVPAQNYVVVGVPEQQLRSGVGQLVYATRQKAWQRFADLPMIEMTVHDNITFGGGDVLADVEAGGKVFVLFENGLDNVAPVGVAPDSLRSIPCRVIPAYSDFGAPGMWKSFPMIRPTFLAQVIPGLKLKILTDYSLPTQYSQPSLPVINEAQWDEALWDVGRWAGTPPAIRKWLGTSGGGYSATVQMDYESAGNLALTNIGWWTKSGGPL